VHGVGEGVGAALNMAVVTGAARGMVGGVEAARAGIPKGLPVRTGGPHRDQTREEPLGRLAGRRYGRTCKREWSPNGGKWGTRLT
jgi:hypothetical protein